MSTNCVTVISARFNDSMEDWILDDMIQNTMKPYFEWQSNNSDCNIEFERIFDNGLEYHGVVDVVATFETPADQALFITSFWDLPAKTLFPLKLA